MADATAIVEPKAGTGTPAAPASESPAPESPSPQLPDELIQLPAMQAILAGKPAAVSAPIDDFAKRPEGALILKNIEPLKNAGFGMYRSLAGNLGVIFNSMHIHGNEIQAADKAGKLLDVAPPFDTVSEMIAKSGANHPILTAGKPTGMKSAPMPETPQMSASVPATQPAGANKSRVASRNKNLQPGSPTSGASPGAGRLLNSILKPVL